MILINHVVVQKQIETWLHADARFGLGDVSVGAVSIKLYDFGEAESKNRALWARCSEYSYEDLERQRDDNSADVDSFTVLFDIGVSDEFGDPDSADAMGTTRTLQYIAQVIKEVLLPKAIIVSGHHIDIEKSKMTIGSMAGKTGLQQSQRGVVLIMGRVICETAQAAITIDPATGVVQPGA